MCICHKKREVEEPDPWMKKQKPMVSSRHKPNSEGDQGVRLRSELLPTSQASPRFKAYPRRFTLRNGLTLFLLLLLGGIGWYFGIGPGRPGLEKGLVNLVRLARQITMPTATPLPTQTPISVVAHSTPTATATLRPTASPTLAVALETATLVPSETPEPTCRDFSTVTLEDVGLELCVQGTVINVIENVGNTLIVFSNEAGAFYLVTYDVNWPDGTIGTCYQVTGVIQQLIRSPIIEFGYNNIPTECP